MDFPHLSDTNFPLLDNVNVYSYRNEFDYTRWVPQTVVKLTNVLWNSDYNDVVKFESNEARDSWFDEHEDDYEITLLANHTLPPEGGIKLPIPYDVAARYNYLVVDIPVMTSSQQPIMYENEDTGMRRWYFFVDEVSSRAPNTTLFVLSLDVWTQFHNDVEINYMFLERGHAPVAATDTDVFLANPINNNEYLLTPDITPSGADIVRDSRFIPFGGGTKYVCIASTLAPTAFGDLGYVTHNSDEYSFQQDLSFYSIDVRHGFDLGIDGIGIGNGDDYSTLGRIDSSEVSSKASNGRIAGNVEVYAIRADYVYQGNARFFTDVSHQIPQFLSTIQGCFIVDESMIEFDTQYTGLTLAGYDVYLVHGAETEVMIPMLQKEQFGFPQEYERFAKLYTYPYSSLELTNNDNEKVTVRIENIGSLAAHQITNIAFPCLRMRMFFTGINGIGSQNYSWKFLNNQTETLSIPKSDWFEYCFDNDIPCYAIYMDGDTAWYLDNFNNKIRGMGRDVEAAYQSSMRISNTQYENDRDYDNTEYTNAQNYNNTNYTNADEDAKTLVANTKRTTDTNLATTNATIAINVEKQEYAEETATRNTDLSNAKNLDLVETSNFASVITADANNETTTSVARNNSQAAIQSSSDIAIAGAGVVATGAAIGTAAAPGIGTAIGLGAGAVATGLTGLMTALANSSAAEASAASMVQANIVSVNANNQANTSNAEKVNTYNASITYNMNDVAAKNVNKNNELLLANTNRSNDNMTDNNGATAATLRGNANRSRNTGNTNASNLKNVKDMNSLYMNHHMRSLNAKQNANAERYKSQYELWTAGLHPARQYGAYAGDPMPDYMGTRGVQMKVRTMSDSEVRQVGDWFARFGYALDQIWDVNESGLCPMNHFCYWKCRDIWVDDMKSSNNTAQRIFVSLFERGVTVWKNPDEIGRVSIYAN